MTLDELKVELEKCLDEVNQKIKVDSPLFFQKSYDFTEVLSRAGKLWSKCKAFYEGSKIDFEIWEAGTELSIRKFMEDLSAAKASLKDKPERITEGRIASELKQDPMYRAKKQEIIDAEELLNLSEKAVYEAGKLRGFISQAIIRKREDTR